MHGMGIRTPIFELHAYYTPKSRIFQVFFSFSTIFVNNALFLENAIMSTTNHVHAIVFIIFNYFSRYRDIYSPKTQNVVLQFFLQNNIGR